MGVACVLSGSAPASAPLLSISLSMPASWLLLWRGVSAGRAFYVGALGAAVSPGLGPILLLIPMILFGLLTGKLSSPSRVVENFFSLPMMGFFFALEKLRFNFILGVFAIASWCWCVGRVVEKAARRNTEPDDVTPVQPRFGLYFCRLLDHLLIGLLVAAVFLFAGNTPAALATVCFVFLGILMVHCCTAIIEGLRLSRTNSVKLAPSAIPRTWSRSLFSFFLAASAGTIIMLSATTLGTVFERDAADWGRIIASPLAGILIGLAWRLRVLAYRSRGHQPYSRPGGDLRASPSSLGR